MKQHPKFINILVTENGDIFSKKKNSFLKQHKNTNGYLIVYISDIGKVYRVHRLVAETYYIDSEYYGLDVNHIDGNKENNNKNNLEWCTRSYNIKHAHKTGLNNCHGETHHSAILTNSQVHEICKMIEEGWRNKDIAEYFGINKDQVSAIKTSNNWNIITSQYNFNIKRNKRLSIDTVKYICSLLEQGMTPTQIKNRCNSNVGEKDIYRIRNGETWSKISKNYKIPKSKRLKEEDVHLICKKLSDGLSVRKIQKETAFSFDQIYKIYKKKSWVDISCKYIFK